MDWLATFRYFRLFLVAVLLLTVGPTRRAARADSCVRPPSDLVSWWPGDGTARDIQDGNNGQELHGVLYASGLVGQAFQFDGFDDMVLVADATNLNFGHGQDFTIDAWINLQNPVAGHTDEIVVKEQHSPTGFSDGYHLRVASDNRELAFGLVIQGVIESQVTSNSVIPLNEWTHVAAVRDGTTGFVYINGVVAGTAQVTDASVANSWPLSIGALYDTRFSPPVQLNHVFGGLIDEVEIFNRALSADEIADIFNAGSAGKCKRVTICHKPGTPAQRTLVIPVQALVGHLGHGDTMGTCQ